MTTATDWKATARTAHQQGNLGGAQDAYKNWLAETPDDPEALHGMGVCAIAEGRSQQAVELFERAATLAPQNPHVQRNLGVAYWTLSRKYEARAALELSDRLEPNNAHTQFNLAVALVGLGDAGGARRAYEHCLTLNPMHAMAHSNLIFLLDLVADDARATEERRKFEQRHGPPGRAQWKPHENPKTSDRRLRIGYVSGDFMFHSASFCFRPVLAHHDRERFEIFCYSATTNPDATTEWYRDEFRWRSLNHAPPNVFADGVRRDRIDILVDLSGHSKDNQLQAFALKPAPVQVTAFGHALGTGLTAMDYLFSDPVVCPPERYSEITERVVNLPAVACYEPQQPAPDVTPLPERTPTFGAYHRLEKVSEQTYDLWAQVMRAVPTARLIAKCPDFEESIHRDRVMGALTRRGVSKSRIELRGKTVHYEHLRQMNDVDVMLDSFPHGGGISTIECLWMGVPVVTRQGQNIQSRLASSFLTTLGLTDAIATGADVFVAIAKTLIGARTYVAEQRASLRDRLLKSPLCDHAGYVRAIEDHYREFWGRWCQS